MFRNRKALVVHPVAAAALLALAHPQVHAQSGGADGAQRIEVTASKRSQLVVDVPYAVTAIGGAEIRDRGVIDIKEMQATVPSMFITDNGPGQSRIQLRGMSTIAGLPMVGMYLDEITINFDQIQRALDLPLVDMARVEVLRGPQGTLYGDGSLGGTIRFITNNPRLDRTSVEAETGARAVKNGETGYYANAVLNLPLAPDIAGLRLVAGYEKIPGWVDDSISGAKDVNSGERSYVRGKASVKLGKQSDLSLLLYHYELEQDYGNFSRADYTVPVGIRTPSTEKTTLASAVVNIDFGFATLTSATGYIDRKLGQHVDVTGFFSRLLPPALLPAGAGLALKQDMSFRVLSEELRLASNDSGPLTWVAGVYFRQSDSFQVRTTPTTAPTPVRILDQQGTSPADTEQRAVFGEVTYAFTPALSLTGGLRWFRDKQELRSDPGNVRLSATFKATSPRVNLLWKYGRDAAAYATVSKGFRSGGFNTTPPPSYGPDFLWNYEIGNKASLMGGKLSYDLAVYYQRYDDVQGLDVPPGSVFATTINTGKASGPGVDLAISAELMRGLNLDVALGWIDIRYDVDTADRRKGDPLNFIPKTTAALGLSSRFVWPGIGLPGMARLDYQHSAKTRTIVRNQNIDISTDAARHVNLRLGVEAKNWQAYLEGRNLNNFNGVINPPLGVQTEAVRPTPRSLGFSVRAQF